MRKILSAFALILFGAATCFAQGAPLHNVAGVYVSQAYNTWRATVFNGPYASGSATLTVSPAYVALADGYTFLPFSTANPITIGQGTANAETDTPSAVSVGPCPSGVAATQPCAFLTVTLTNAHGQGDIVVSGSNGIDEALTDAGAHGGGMVYWSNTSGQVTLNTSGATTTLCTGCIPQNALVLGVVARVGTAITGCTGGWELGDGTTATRFTAANTTLTAGTVSAADLQTTSGVASTTTGMLAAASKSIVNTCVTANASAGSINVSAFGYILATPAQ